MSTDMLDDFELFIVLVTVAGVIFLQTLAVISCLYYNNYHGKAKWRRLRKKGIVVVNGPALYWADDDPLPPIRPSFDMRRTEHGSQRPRHVQIAEKASTRANE